MTDLGRGDKPSAGSVGVARTIIQLIKDHDGCACDSGGRAIFSTPWRCDASEFGTGLRRVGMDPTDRSVWDPTLTF